MPDRIAMEAGVLKTRIEVLLRTFPELAEDDDLLVSALEGETELHPIMSRLVRMRQDRRFAAEGVALYIDDLAARKERMLHGASGITALIKALMDAAGIEKLVLPEATIFITQARSSVTVVDVDSLPQGYFLTVRKPNTDAIGKALRNGEDIPGAALTFGEAGLTVRTK